MDSNPKEPRRYTILEVVGILCLTGIVAVVALYFAAITYAFFLMRVL